MLYHHNIIVSFSSDCYTEDDFDFKTFGLHIIADKWKANLMPYRTLDIKLKASSNGISSAIYPTNPADLVFLGEDLPTFCRALLLRAKHWQDRQPSNFLSTSSLWVEQNKSVAIHTGKDDQSATYVPKNLERFLQPLRQLHSFQTASVIGNLNDQFKADLRASICREQPSGGAVLHDIVTAIKKGDEARASNKFSEALSIYLAAARDNTDRGYCLPQTRPSNTPGAAPDGRLHSAFVGNLFALRMKLGETCLQLRLWQDAYQWSMRAVDQIAKDWIDPGQKSIANPYQADDWGQAHWLMVRTSEGVGKLEEALMNIKKLLRLKKNRSMLEAEMKRLEGKIASAAR